MSRLAVLAGVALPFVVSPGVSLTLTVHHTVAGRRWAGLLVAAGTVAGMATIAGTLAWSPLGPALAAHPESRRWLALLGGAVLAVLGVRLLWSARRASTPDAPPAATPWALVRDAYVGVLLNPKALTVYLVVVPALTDRIGATSPPFGPFACVHAVMQVVWLVLVGLVAVRLPLARGRRALAAVAGTFLLVAAAQVVDGTM